jgi:DNA-binding HxlR family transcriptional regulator
MSGVPHPRHRLDPVIHHPIRLSIVACLAEVAEAEFGFVRDTVEISAATLSRQVTVLEARGYLTMRKGYIGRRPRTWLALAPAGRQALAAHLDALRSIAGHGDPAASATGQAGAQRPGRPRRAPRPHRHRS